MNAEESGFKSFRFDGLVKSQNTPVHEAREGFSSQIFKVNSNSSTNTPGRGLIEDLSAGGTHRPSDC